MQLEEPSSAFAPEQDRRPRVPEPLPVRLVAIKDVRLEAPAGVERDLDALYGALLGMERVYGEAIVYRAENFDLYVDVLEPPIPRVDFRPLRVLVKSLDELEPKLIDAKLEYVRRRGLMPGDEALVLQDAAGNWVEVTQVRPVA